MCKCTLAPPKHSGALAPPQRSNPLRHRALERSRAPPGAAPRCAATCCALTQPYAVPLCPDTTLRCAPAHPSAVPLDGHAQRPCPARPPRLPRPRLRPCAFPANRAVDVRLRPVAFLAQPPGPPQPDAASPARQASAAPTTSHGLLRPIGVRPPRPRPPGSGAHGQNAHPPPPPPRGPDPTAATPAAGREAVLRPRPVGHATLADDATPAGPRALPRATGSPLPATGVCSAARADRTQGNRDAWE